MREPSPLRSVWVSLRRPFSYFLLTPLAIALLVSRAASAGDDVQALADRIDNQISQGWKNAAAEPAPPSDDAEFLRRVSLHLIGCIPDVSTVRRFLADKEPNKRRRYVDELLDGPGYVMNFTRFWRSAMLPEVESKPELAGFSASFEAWLRQQLAADTPYDELVRQIINSEAQAGSTPVDARLAAQSPSARAFYLARQSAPAEVTAATTRAFLGVRIECAQCHDHPFDEWKRDHFWSLAAFVGTAVPGPGRTNLAANSGEPLAPKIGIPDTDRVVTAAFLSDEQPTWKATTSPRALLADWITSRSNPYFARATANRMWGYLFGIGLVEPIDDFSGHNPASHGELLDNLARELADHDFDIKFLLRAITASKTYQLSSRRTHASQDNRRLFARMSVQALSASQIFDSLSQATGQRPAFQPFNPFVARGNTPQAAIQELFAAEGQSSIDREATILQALALMNGELVTQATDMNTSRMLAAVVAAPFMNASEKIETLYLATLSRKPRPEELERLQRYVESAATIKGRNNGLGEFFRSLVQRPDDARSLPPEGQILALADVFWSLLNSSEFSLNH